MISFLINVVNPMGHHVPHILEPALNQMLLTFVFDISALVKRELNQERYEERHKVLLLVNKNINDFTKQYNDNGYANTGDFNAFLMSYFS